MPNITVLMSCLNAEKWLHPCVCSVLQQLGVSFEFLIINDGSTDNTISILQEYAQADERVRIIDKPNTGLSDSLNMGIRHARSEWIARIDADDICAKDRLLQQHQLALSHPKIVLVGSGFSEIDSTGNLVKIHSFPVFDQGLRARLKSSRPFFAHSSAFFRTEAVRSIGGYRDRLQRAEDLDLWLRLSEVGIIRAIRAPLVKIRKHEAQISNEGSGNRQLADALAATTCFFIRRELGHDPLMNGAQFGNEFIAWIENKMAERKIYEQMNNWRRFKSEYIERNSQIARTIFAVKQIMLHPDLQNHLLNKYIGSTLAENLAKDWIDSQARDNKSL